MKEHGLGGAGLLAAATALAVIAAGACVTRGPAPETWEQVPTFALSESQREQLAAAEKARDALFGELMGTLSNALVSEGAAGAIRVCKDEAPRIADSLSHELGVRMGRTAVLLRNPDNSAPDWAEFLYVELPTETRTATSSKGRLGVTFPIRLSAACVTCHGASDEIPREVKQALAHLYPSDRATGFREGDLRGWLWVEVPP